MKPVSLSVHNLVCPYCGTENPDGANLCHTCGSSLQNAPTVQKPISSLQIPPSDDHLKPGTQLHAGRYLIVDVLGQGGFGITYRVMDAQHGGYVAIKEFYPQGAVSRGTDGNIVPDRAFVRDFERGKLGFSAEAQKLSKFRHPSIVHAQGLFIERNTAYLVMEYLHGVTLEQRIATGKLLTEYEARTILLQLLAALEEVHALGVLHRDIKPANIVLTDERAELIDFGSSAKFIHGHAVKVSQRLLTPAYAPLEQYATSAKLGPWTDLYALGATFYEAVTGVQPPSALERANGAVLKPIRDINPMIREPFAKALEKALEPKVDARPNTASALRTSLHEASRANKALITRQLSPIPPVPTPALAPSAPQTNQIASQPPKRNGKFDGNWAAVIVIIFFVLLPVFAALLTHQ
jgi:serine/threonine protein kinase